MPSPPYLLPLPSTPELIPKAKEALAYVENALDFPTELLQRIVDQFIWEFREGLTKDITPKNKDTFLPMIGTFLTSVPDGSEKGVFLACDLGGTNLRVCEIRLDGNHGFSIEQQKYKVSEELKTGDASELFDYIAKSIGDFLALPETSNVTEEERLHLGFTFSFPVEQIAINSGSLISWTKGFSAKSTIGNDVVKLLQDALDKRNIHVLVSALVNDTCGTLLARSYQSGSALIGAIFGTGTNGCYVEKIERLERFREKAGDNLAKTSIKNMIVNTEWGAFDNERRILPISIFDNKLDRESINPRKQAFEKMVSGMYLGEVVRNIVLHFIDLGILFKGYSTPQLNTHYGFDSELMSNIEAGGKFDIETVRRVLLSPAVGISKDLVTDEDCLLVYRASEVVGTRGARLSAAAIAAIIKQTEHDQDPENEDISVGVDGSLVEFYPRFEERVRDALKEILGDKVEKRVKIGLAKDGSGVGAALCALASKMQHEQGKRISL